MSRKPGEWMKKAVEIARDLRKNLTSAEDKLWQAIRNRKLDGKKYLRQFPISFIYEGKQRFMIADFYCHEKRLVIEVDGKIHLQQKEQDLLRDEMAFKLALKVMRIKNQEIENELEKVLERIKLMP